MHPNSVFVQRILDATQNGIVVYEAIRSETGIPIDFQISNVNAAYARLAGKPVDQLSGSSLRDAYPVQVCQTLTDRYRQCLQTRTADRFDISFLHPQTGQHVWYNVSVVSSDERLIVSIQDNTASMLLQAQLKQSGLICSAFQASLSGITVFEPVLDETGEPADFRFIMINDAGLTMSKTTADALLGRTIREFYPQTENKGLFQAYVQVYKTRQPLSGEHYYSDHQVWRQYSIMYTDGNIMVSYNDITDQKQMELVQRKQTDFYETIFANTQVGLAIFAPQTSADSIAITDFTYVFANPATASQVNRPVDGLINQSLCTLFPGIEQTILFQHMITVAHNGLTKRFLFPHFGEKIKGWFDCTLARIGHVILLSSMDVSDSYHHQQQLELVNRELRLANDNLHQFAYVASHDLQEPLRKIQSFGELLVNQYNDRLDTTALDIIRRMYASSERMSVLIHDLLAYSRISTHRDPFELINVADILAAVTEELSIQIEQTNTQLDIGKLPDILGDVTQLHQLFKNLIANAIKYQRPDVSPVIMISSRLVVGTELDEYPLAEIIMESKFTDGRRRAYHEITIADNGIGFDERYRDRIFQVFQRLHGRSQYEGSGIGLAICKKVADNHRGAITAYSQPGQGSRFVVYLPLQR
ncbi:hypothetical protein BLX24_13100 [Arsenicibacter rosenii]|uniref:histidine kinase n=2 Tax=Arsenicibacter rosenii TaxID=1750698 RepID=A0A1S2VIC2_9BACT|nr:hypothetical protein BLX24_13100 [Arsenicibacter rosenii]